MLRHSRLTHLVPIIQACCSDDDTDDEAPVPSPTESLTRSSRPIKRVIVNELPWRHAQVKRLMIAIDCLRSQRLVESLENLNAPPPRERKRVEHPRVSTLPHPIGLPVTFYRDVWMNKLSVYKAEALHSKIHGPPLNHFITIAETLL